MKKPSKALWAALAAALLLACQINDVECDKECKDQWMDGGNWRDSSLMDLPHPYLVSARKDSLGDADKLKPVIIAVHGFTASTYEWLELRRFAGDTVPGAGVLVSLVLLGGHGRDIDTFQSSTWRDWGRPILAEYDSLLAKGYRNISFAGASTGCSLLLQYLSEGAFRKRDVQPKWFFFIDPIVTPTSKALSLVNFVGGILGNSPNPMDTAESHYWYTNRPAEDLAQLYELINRVKNELEDGITLPAGTQAKVWKAKRDGSADPVSALQIYKGLSPASGGHIQVEMVDSRKHVFTRLQGRGLKPDDPAFDLQRKTFREMVDKASAP
jgi:carboxylesterase